MNTASFSESVYDRMEIITDSGKRTTFTVKPGVGYAAPEGFLLSMTV